MNCETNELVWENIEKDINLENWYKHQNISLGGTEAPIIRP